MRTTSKLLFAIASIFFTAGVWAGCTVGFDSDQSGVFPCETDEDCADNFECEDQLCIEPGPQTSPPCDQEANPPRDIDLDNDGYGTGSDRTQCPEANRAYVDCDDQDPEVHPNSPELCDNKDNNCDGQGSDGANRVDEFDCENPSDCAKPDPDLPVFATCRSGQCVLVPSLQSSPGCEDIAATCNSSEGAFTYTFDGTTKDISKIGNDCSN